MMPRSTDEILSPAPTNWRCDSRNYEPAANEGIDARALRDIRHAFLRRAEAERERSARRSQLRVQKATPGRQSARCWEHPARQRDSATDISPRPE